MKVIYEQTFTLIPESVDEISEKMGEFLAQETGTERKEIWRLRLSAEEVLLNWMQTEQGSEVQFIVEQHGSKIDLILDMRSSHGGAQKNPFKHSDELGYSEMAEGLLANLGVTWMYQYQEGVNRVYIRIPKKKGSQIRMMLLAVVLAVVSGEILKILPPSVAQGCSTYLFDPFFETFMGFLSAIVSPMMFLTVIWGVFSIGNPKRLGTIGKTVFLRFLKHNGIAVLLGMVFTACFFPFSLHTGEGGENQIKMLLDMVYDIVPDNIISPFQTGNTLQIIFMAVVIGITMVFLQNQVTYAAKVIEQLNTIIQQILTMISRFIPAFIYLSIVRLVLSDQIAGIGGFVKMILLFVMGSVLLFLYYLISAVRKMRISPVLLWKKLLPAYLVALTTGSSAAAFSGAATSCTDDLGIEKQLVNFGLPLGIVIYMPNFAMWLVLFGGACAEYYGQMLSPVDLVTLMVLGLFLAMAAPPIPGSALTCYTIFLMQMNMPMDVLAIATAINFVVDFVGTSGHIMANQVQLLLAAESMGMVDRKKLEAAK